MWDDPYQKEYQQRLLRDHTTDTQKNTHLYLDAVHEDAIFQTRDEIRRKATKKGFVRLAIECALIILWAFIYSFIFTLPYCNFLFSCGCTWLWKGGVEHCNINNDSGPKCPWCAAPTYINWIPQWGGMMMMILGALCIRHICKKYLPKHSWHRDLSFPVFETLRVTYSLIGAVIIFYLFGLINGYIFKIASDYPYFL